MNDARTRAPRRSALFLATLSACLLISIEATAHLTLIRQEWESAGQIEAGERLGQALATGDFDADGFDDLASGAPNDPVGFGSVRYGTVVINRGSRWGLTHENAYGLISGTTDDDARFGSALAAGDFDGDGDDDLAVGAPWVDVLSGEDAGKVFVFDGQPALGLTILASTTLVQEDAGGFSSSFDRFGWSLAVGRFNADPYDDLAVGAPGEAGDSGAVYYFYGSPTGLSGSAAGELVPFDYGDSPHVGAQFGFSLAAGDLYGGDEDELVIGSPYRLLDATTIDAGRIYVVDGIATGIVPGAGFKRDASEFGLVVRDESHFGWALATGHFTAASGKLDLAIGEPGDYFSTPAKQGRVIVTHLDTPLLGLDDWFVLTENDAVLGDRGFNDWFGYALAAGDMDDDGDDELAVASPFDTFALGIESAGAVHLFVRQADAVGDSTVHLDPQFLHESALDDETGVGNGWRFGEALAFGNCDGFSRSSLVVGAPRADFQVWEKMEDLGLAPLDQTGQVHVYAPWRQVFDLQSRSAAVWNCEDELVFSQRGFDPLSIASTTKTMTLLLACEDITSGALDSNVVYQMPFWPTICFLGSDGGLVENEQLRLIDYMKLAMTQSAGDACYAIADIASGQVDAFPVNCINDDSIVMPTFVQRMNDRAQQIGMSATLFTNPTGSRSGSAYGPGRHHSTATDMMKLGRVAMQNPLFRHLAGTEEWTIERQFKVGNMLVPVLQVLPYGWLTSVKGLTAGLAIGIKPGGSGFADQTTLGAIEGVFFNNAPPIAGVFGVNGNCVDSGVSDLQRNCKTAQLLQLGRGQCTGPGPNDFAPPPDVPEPPYLSLLDLPAGDGQNSRAMTQLNDPAADVLVEIGRWRGGGSTVSLEAVVRLDSERTLGPGETATYGIAPFDRHAGFRLFNPGPPNDFLISTSHPSSSEFVSLGPGESYVVGAHDAPGERAFSLSVQNLNSAGSVTILLEELGYGFDLVLGDGTTLPSDFSATLTRSGIGEVEFETLDLVLLGQDPDPDARVTLVARNSGQPTGVRDPEGDGPRAHPAIPRLSIHPNPFNPRTSFSFELRHESRVELRVYDLRGRRVATLIEAILPAGAHGRTWNGTDDGGRAAASGVYVVELVAEGWRESRKVALVR